MVGIKLLLSLLLAVTVAPDTTADCGEQVCLYAEDGDSAGSWKPDSRMSAKQRKAEAKKQRKNKDVALRVELEDGRGSVFVDGRYLATQGPHGERGVKPGKHEVEVRDGDEVIAVGVLSVGRKIKSLTLVVHADR